MSGSDLLLTAQKVVYHKTRFLGSKYTKNAFAALDAAGGAYSNLSPSYTLARDRLEPRLHASSIGATSLKVGGPPLPFPSLF